MKYTLFVWIIASIGSICSYGQLSRLSISGNQFVDESGQTVVLRGVSTSDPDKLEKEGHWDAGYFDEIKRWGANVVRFPVHPRAWQARGAEAYLQLLDEGVRLCTERSLYVIIDWHSIGNLQSELFFKPGYETTRKETFTFWQTIAQRYGDNPTVAFYELFNEPTTNGGKLGIANWEGWKALNEEMITIIRSHGATGIPLVAGFNWAYDLTAAYENPIDRQGIGYVSHPYPQKRPQPWENAWTEDWGLIKEKYPVILTEIGFSLANEKGAHIPVISDETYGEAITTYCDEREISYVAWVFDPLWSPMLFSDWDYTPTTQGAFFKRHFESYSPSKP
ncbi:glycoside hydrolase family 5 protein [Marinoscillum furvescens]|uniref:Aryl-phospho-beta-D-glucosidase BglC (GH1 family) n=1 Tax=Marinoscillum furvescens DSM 4134 TaxID=1122208 RepID=A0A3D9KZT9_MARFU|nr:glycoside hydrolase family 5 protein [Marinoscillum furvescens]RED94097.1 aryl-phospho-beta-D-glucosidase BglC (GH1 family) [Marinoscillum furvescens DSM 4134]